MGSTSSKSKGFSVENFNNKIETLKSYKKDLSRPDKISKLIDQDNYLIKVFKTLKDYGYMKDINIPKNVKEKVKLALERIEYGEKMLRIEFRTKINAYYLALKKLYQDIMNTKDKKQLEKLGRIFKITMNNFYNLKVPYGLDEEDSKKYIREKQQITNYFKLFSDKLKKQDLAEKLGIK
jgi:hypothetical protein